MNNSLSPCYETVKRFVNHLEQKGLIETLALSDEDIADTLWLAWQMEVEKAQPKKSPISRLEDPQKPVEEIITTVNDSNLQPKPSINLHTQDAATQEEKQAIKPKTKGLPFQTPAAPALPNKLAIGRALRPLMRKVPSPTRNVLDIEATVTRIAEQDIWLPVTKPEPEKWLDLELIVEKNKSTFIWQETITELEALLRNHGAFRRFRTWTLWNPEAKESSDKKNLPKLTRRKKGGQIIDCEHSYRELISSNGRSLIILLSDCVSSIWQQETIYDWLEKWSEKVPTTIMQLFPERLWLSTELGFGYKVKFSAFNPGVPNSKLVLWEKLDIKEGLNLPIITLQTESIKYWAKVIAGFGSTQTPGIILDVKFVKEQVKTFTKSSFQTSSLDPEIIVDRFLATASPTAQQLAGFMAAAPVSLPVVHLIQRTLLPNVSTPVHIAEVFLSSMIERKEGEIVGTSLINSRKDEKESKQYDFVPGVRKLLNQAMPIGQTEKVLDVISEYIAQNLGLSIKSFTALLLRHQDLSKENQEKILPFARVTLEVLSNLGGEYTAWAMQLESPVITKIPEKEPVFLLPNRRTFTFEVALVVFEDEDETELASSIDLQPFEFEVATLESKQTGWFRRKTELAIKRTRQQAWGYSEDLGNNVQLEMVAIPDGNFKMGSPKDESGQTDRESPQHQVTLKSFFIGKYPVTQAQWKAVATLPQINRELNPDPSGFKGNDRPVESISWLDAVEFCDRLSQHTGKPYRLPSEAEWEYCCRAGTTTPFHFGETITTDLANYDGNYTYGAGSKGIYRKETTPVGSFGVANAFGLYDMHGNVWEWCADRWHSNYEGAPADGSPWDDEQNENENYSQIRRVLRGGSWLIGPDYCRSAYRYRFDAGGSYDSFGFRVGCAAEWTQ